MYPKSCTLKPISLSGCPFPMLVPPHTAQYSAAHTHTYIHIISYTLLSFSSPLYQIKQTNKNKHSLQSLFSCTPTPQYSTHSTLQFTPTQPNRAEKHHHQHNQSTMALRMNPLPTQTYSFALPQMASLRSPKFVMASTLRSGAKSVPPFPLFSPDP